VPIGLVNEFKGLFDGNDYSITNLKITTKTSNDTAALFGNVSNTIIKNLNVSNVNIKNNKYAAILAVNALGTQIKNCNVDGNIISSNNAEIGGIANNLTGKAYNCSSILNVISGKNSYIGGIANSFSGKLSLCESTVDIRAETGSTIGGISAQASGRLINCNSMGDLKGASVVGGIVGKMNISSTLQASTFDGTMDGDNIVGGIVGFGLSNIIIDLAKNKGNIDNGKIVGGIVGQLNEDSKIFNCESTGDIVSYVDNAKIGGLVGEVLGESKLLNSYSISNLLGNNIVGGLVGELVANSEIRYCYSSGNMNVAPGILGANIGKVYDEYTATDQQSGIYYNSDAEYLANGSNVNNQVAPIGNILKSKPIVPKFDMSLIACVSDDGITTTYNIALLPDYMKLLTVEEEAELENYLVLHPPMKYIKLTGFNGIDNLNYIVHEFNDFIKYEGRYVLSNFLKDNNSTVNDGFPYLENRTIVDNEELEVPLEINEIYFENDLYIVNLIGELPSNAIVVLSAYDENNRFIGLRQQYISLENNYYFDYTGETIYKLKALVFENYNTIKPLCATKEFGG
jgi:hypothetical protein